MEKFDIFNNKDDMERLLDAMEHGWADLKGQFTNDGEFVVCAGDNVLCSFGSDPYEGMHWDADEGAYVGNLSEWADGIIGETIDFVNDKLYEMDINRVVYISDQRMSELKESIIEALDGTDQVRPEIEIESCAKDAFSSKDIHSYEGTVSVNGHAMSYSFFEGEVTVDIDRAALRKDGASKAEIDMIENHKENIEKAVYDHVDARVQEQEKKRGYGQER